MNLIFFMLAFLDIVGGLFYILSINFTILYTILIVKGAWSISSCIISRDYFYTIFGIIDLFAGIFGFLEVFKLQAIGVILILKGIYSIIFSF